MSLASRNLSFFNNSLKLETLIGGRRWLRRMRPQPGKPPILPPSKQVLYRIVNGDWEEPEYVQELLCRRHVYNNAMISIQKLFREETRSRESAGLGIENLKKQEQLELNELIEENERRNSESAALRKKRYEEKIKNFRQEVINEIQNTLNIEAADIEKRNEEVRKYIEESVNYITPENLESKIIEALENPVVYDFAIDLNGQKFYSPTPVKYLEGQPTRQKSRMYDVSHSKLGG